MVEWSADSRTGDSLRSLRGGQAFVFARSTRSVRRLRCLAATLVAGRSSEHSTCLLEKTTRRRAPATATARETSTPCDPDLPWRTRIGRALKAAHQSTKRL